MIVANTGHITKNLFMLGSIASPIFLLDGKSPVIVDAGVSMMGEVYVSELRRILMGRSPRFLFLTHAHFGHCGAAGILKSAFPDMEIAASPAGRDILARPNALKLIRELNVAAFPQAEKIGASFPLREFVPFDVDLTLLEGDTFILSEDLSLRVLETPGHTRDSLSFYIPEEGLLFSGEAIGIPDQTGHVVNESLSDFDQYMASMERIASLKPEALAIGHYCVFTGEDVPKHLAESFLRSRAFKDLILSWSAEPGMAIETMMGRLKKIEYDGKREEAQPEAAYFINLKARIHAILASRSAGISI